jgi:hypothetical protein
MIDPSQLTWPDPSDKITDDELKKALYTAELEVVTNQLSALADREKVARASFDTMNQAVFNAYLDVAKGQIERATSRAEFIEKAAGTIATLYTGILAFTFNAELSKGKAFPAVGIAPTIFLGLSIVLAMFYLAYIMRPRRFKASTSSGLLPQHLIDERNNFISWASNSVLERAPWLQTAVLSLGFGVIFLPVVYLTAAISEAILWLFVGAGVLITLLHLAVRLINQTSSKEANESPVNR